MTLNEAIKHCLEVAEYNDLAAGTYDLLAENNHNLYEKLTAESNSKRCTEFAGFNRQLAEWLTELKEAKRLLKLAVDDLSNSIGAMYTCPYCKYVDRKSEVCAIRQEQYCGDICEWRYADEALKLIGND